MPSDSLNIEPDEDGAYYSVAPYRRVLWAVVHSAVNDSISYGGFIGLSAIDFLWGSGLEKYAFWLDFQPEGFRRKLLDRANGVEDGADEPMEWHYQHVFLENYAAYLKATRGQRMMAMSESISYGRIPPMHDAVWSPKRRNAIRAAIQASQNE